MLPNIASISIIIITSFKVTVGYVGFVVIVVCPLGDITDGFTILLLSLVSSSICFYSFFSI